MTRVCTKHTRRIRQTRTEPNTCRVSTTLFKPLAGMLFPIAENTIVGVIVDADIYPQGWSRRRHLALPSFDWIYNERHVIYIRSGAHRQYKADVWQMLRRELETDS